MENTGNPDGEYAISSGRQFRRFALAVALLGVVLQFALSTYYLGVGHAPRPRDVPVGVIGSAQQRQSVVALIEKQGGFSITGYDSVQALAAAVGTRQSLGGLDVTGTTPHLYLSMAAGPTAANYMRAAFTTVIQQQVQARVTQLVQAGQPVPTATVSALTTPPDVTDLTPLPSNDKYGSSLGFLVQALALGGTIASAGLGVLVPKTRRSAMRGLNHLVVLVIYAAGSAAAVEISMKLFGIGGETNGLALYSEFFLVSLAITGSIAACVALIGQPGMGIGLIYFGVGTVISGASIPSEFLPDFARIVGQGLPTGAGARAVRDSLYFPAAWNSGPILILTAYAVVGCLVLLLTNIQANPGDRTSELQSVLPYNATLVHSTAQPTPGAD